MTKDYGRFSEDGKEYIITTPQTPRPWENRIWNDILNIQITNHGTGITYERDKTGRFILFNYSHDRYIYVHDKDTGELWSPSWFPVNRDLDAYECRHGLKYTEITGQKNGVEVCVKTTVHAEDATEVWQIEVRNLTAKKKNIQLVSFYKTDISFKDPYWGEANRYRGFKSENENCLFIKNFSHKRDMERYAVAYHSDLAFDKYEMDPAAFLENYSSFPSPATILNDHFTGSKPDKGQPCLCVAYDIELGKNQTRTINAQIFSADDLQTAEARCKIYNSTDLYAESIAFHTEDLDSKMSVNHLMTGDASFDRYVNIWIKHQLHYNAEWNRGWGMGFRDAMQDCDSWRLHDLGLVRKRIIQAATHIYSDGHTVRKWAGLDTKLYFDGGVWFVNTLANYIKESGDTAILDETHSYLDGGEGTLLDHAKRTMNFLNAQRGPGGICRMGYGDWNDAIEGIDREGKGESVWTTMAYIWSLRTFIELLAQLGDQAAMTYQAIADEMVANLNENYFEDDRYIRAVTDAGRRIGIEENDEGKIFLNPQSWSMIANIATSERAATVVEAVKERLYSPWGPCLLAPAYTEYKEDIGRITSDPTGFAENGANYVHASMFFAYGLTKSGNPDEAFAVLQKVLPSNPEHDSSKSGLEPYNLTNAYEGKESAHAGRAMFAWRTGTAGWFLKVIWDGILGILPNFEQLDIKANIPAAWLVDNPVEAERTVRGNKIKFIFAKEGQTASADLIVENNVSINYSDLKDGMRILIKLHFMRISELQPTPPESGPSVRRCRW